MAIPVRSEAYRLLESNPEMTYAEVGRLLGVSRERIRQVSSRPAKPGKYCNQCGMLVKIRISGVTDTAYRQGFCGACWLAEKARRKHKKSQEHRQDFACEECGSSFSRTLNAVRAQRKKGSPIRWCSKQCQGRWLGRTFTKWGTAAKV